MITYVAMISVLMISGVLGLSVVVGVWDTVRSHA